MKNDTLLRINDFSSLPKGWHFGEGSEISDDAIDVASKVFYGLFSQGISITDAFPGVDGEVRVTGYFNEHYIEITVENDCSITYLYEVNDIEKEYQENISFSDALSAIKKITTNIDPDKCLYDQSTKTIGINKKSASKALHLGLQAMEAFQLFVFNAPQTKVVVVSESIPNNTMPLSLIPRQSSGCSTYPYSPAITRSMKPPVHRVTFATAT